jgi:predicted XRE-type DNA-binding protein
MKPETAQALARAWAGPDGTPEWAANMLRRAELLVAIRAVVETWGQYREGAADRLGVTRSRLNDLRHGRLDKFSVDSLITLAERVGLVVTVRIHRTAALSGASRSGPRGELPVGADVEECAVVS